MLGRLGRDAGSLLGVEITANAIKMLQVRRQRGGVQVVGRACQALVAPGAGAQMAKALVQAHRRCATAQRKVALALPASQVICKLCQLPQGTHVQDIEARLLGQADQLFPFPIDDLALDFQVVGASRCDLSQVDVLVAACRQSQLDPLEALFAEAGLELVAMEVDSFALRRALLPEGAEGWALVRVEANMLVLHHWAHNLLPMRQQLPLGADVCWVDELVSLVGAACGQLHGVVVAGEGADAARVERLTQRLGVACRLADPAVVSAGGTGPGPCMALAYGLAMGGLR